MYFEIPICLTFIDKLPVSVNSTHRYDFSKREIYSLFQNGRVAKNIVVSVSNRGPRSFNTSKTCAIVRYDAEKLTEDTYQLVSKLNQAGPTQSSW